MNETNNSSGNTSDSGMPPFAIAMVTIQLIIMVVVVIGNGLVLVAFMYFPSLRDVTGIFVANLALSDLLLGLSLPFQVAFFFYPELEINKYACLMRFQLITFTCNASLYSLVCTVFDRYLAITYPLTYATMMSEKVAYIMTAVVWTVDIVFSLIPSFGANNFDTSPFCLYEFVIHKNYILVNTSHACALCLLMFLAYVRIFAIVHRHMKQIHSETSHTGGNPSNMPRSKQTNTIVALVVLFFQVSWLPFFIIQFSSAYEVTPTKVMTSNFLVFLGIMNSMVNPVIYVWKNKRYRRAFKKIICFRLESDELDTSFGPA